MLSNRQNNYWQKDSDTDEILDTYTPELDNNDDATPEYVDTSKNIEPQKYGENPVYWVADEYISQDKNHLWYVIFAFVILLFITADILFLKSYTFSILVIVMAISVIVYSRRAPRKINYTLSSDQGLYIGEKLYHFNEFKSFGLITDDGQHSIMLIPIKRFAPGISVYFPEEVGEEIIDILGSVLPMEKLKLDIIDIIVKNLRL